MESNSSIYYNSSGKVIKIYEGDGVDKFIISVLECIETGFFALGAAVRPSINEACQHAASEVIMLFEDAKKGREGILEFTTGDTEYAGTNSDMLEQEMSFYSLSTSDYEKYLKENGFKILLRESDQAQHLVWIAKKTF